jgi:hypothetical protein
MSRQNKGTQIARKKEQKQENKSGATQKILNLIHAFRTAAQDSRTRQRSFSHILHAAFASDLTDRHELIKNFNITVDQIHKARNGLSIGMEDANMDRFIDCIRTRARELNQG